MTRLISRALLILFICASFSNAGADEYVFEGEKKFKEGELKELTVEIPHGAVNIYGTTNSKRATVKYRKVIEADSKNAAGAQAGKIKIEFKEVPYKKIILHELHTVFPENDEITGHVEYDIIAPERIFVYVKTTSADIRASDFKGPIRVESESSNIDIENEVSGMTLGTTSGNINLNNQRGDLKLNSVSGNVTVENGIGDVMITTVSGNIEYGTFEGILKVWTKSGNINVTDLKGPIEIHSESGNIICRYVRGNYDITTVSGKIDAHVNTDEGWIHKFKTETGDIDIQVEGANKYDFDAKTSHGDLNIGIDYQTNLREYKNIKGTSSKGIAPRNTVNINMEGVNGDISLKPVDKQ